LFSNNQAIKKLDIDVAKKFFKEQYLRDKGGIDERMYNENTREWYTEFDDHFETWFNKVKKDGINPVTTDEKNSFLNSIEIF